MWDDLLKRWIDLLFWWAPRTEETRPDRADERSPVASNRGASGVLEQAVEPQAATAEPVAADDLTVIKGIGPAVQEKLRSRGITTFGDLAAANPDDLAAHLKGSQPVSIARVDSWIKAARERVGSRS